MTMTLCCHLADIEYIYLIIFILLDAKVKIIKDPEQPLSGWSWLSIGRLVDIESRYLIIFILLNATV